MDQETLTNHLSRSGKATFEIACRMVLRCVFNLNSINVDGSGDGGTDFISISKDGARSNTTYQITTQKKSIEQKAYRDAKKVIEKLESDRFYFFSTLNLSETQARKIENEINEDLKINSFCFGSRHIAGFLIEEGLVSQFLDESGYPVPMDSKYRPDYREMALHAYTIMSKDVIGMREGIYDDTILFILSDNEKMEEDVIVSEVLHFLNLKEHKTDLIKKRIGALFGRKCITRSQDGLIKLNEKTNEDLVNRKRIYDRELSNLAAAQIDIMRRDFGSNWSIEDSKTISVFIADAYIADQIQTLKEIKASIVINPIFQPEEKGINNLKSYLVRNRRVSPENVNVAVEKLIKAAADHPLIAKLARASIYVALEGANPTACARALGAGRWCDYHILVEPTVAIPWICSQLYTGDVNRFFDTSIKSIERAKELEASLNITYFYINECAGHLLRARKYIGLEFNPEELQHSPNAYISNYYSLKKNGTRVPDNLLDYLKTFSAALMIERHDVREWVRAVMTDLQTILNRSGIHFIESPMYQHEQCVEFEKEYVFNLQKYRLEKSFSLINHDVWALQFTHDSYVQKGQNWFVLTYDRSMIDVGKTDRYSGWVATPDRFLDLTEIHKPLSDTRYVSLLHSFASYSEKTLSAGARVIDKIVQYASPELQNWEFRKELEEFKNGIVDQTDLDSDDALHKIDSSTDGFLEKHGIIKTDRKVEEEVDINS